MGADKKKLLKTVLRIVALGCVGVFLGFNIYLWNAQSLTGNALPMPFGFGTAVVLSGSMEPELSVDDLIFVRESGSYAVGDVVVYQSGSMLVVHRIISLEGDKVVTQGDANNAPDSEISLSAIKGRVIGRVKNAGGAVRLMKSPVVSIGLLAGAVVLLERSYRKEKQQGDAKLEKIKEEIRQLKAQQEE